MYKKCNINIIIKNIEFELHKICKLYKINFIHENESTVQSTKENVKVLSLELKGRHRLKLLPDVSLVGVISLSIGYVKERGFVAFG